MLARFNYWLCDSFYNYKNSVKYFIWIKILYTEWWKKNNIYFMSKLLNFIVIYVVCYYTYINVSIDFYLSSEENL